MPGEPYRGAAARQGEDAVPQPVLAVVGRPNVGKSTLVNRILGRREAVVQDVPGVTRDRVAYDALWNGRKFTVVDTGGWEPDAKGLQGAVAALRYVHEWFEQGHSLEEEDYVTLIGSVERAICRTAE